MNQITKERVSKTTYPDKQLTQDEWFRKFGVASSYVKPTNYFGGNEFNTQVFLGRHRTASGNLFGKIFNLLTTLSWAN